MAAMATILDFGFPIATIFAVFDLQVTLMQETKRKIDFEDGSHLRFPIGMILAFFLSTSHLDASYQVSSQLVQGCRRSRLLKQLLMPHDAL